MYGLNQIVISVFLPANGDPPRWKISGMGVKMVTDTVSFEKEEFPLAVAKICEYMARLEPPGV